MITTFSKLWFILSLGAVFFVGGVYFAQSPEFESTLAKLFPKEAVTNSAQGSLAQTSVYGQSQRVAPYIAPAQKLYKSGPVYRNSRSAPQRHTMPTQADPAKANATRNAYNSNRLGAQAYDAATVLDNLWQTRWIYSEAGIGACATKPQDHWVFSNTAPQQGFQCRKVSSSSDDLIYECGQRQRFHKYAVKFGNEHIGNGIQERPHITLERVTRRSKKVRLKMCIRGDTDRASIQDVSPLPG